MQVKENQKGLLDDCVFRYKYSKPDEEEIGEIENARNRIEQRSVFVFREFGAMDPEWALVKGLVVVVRSREALCTKKRTWIKTSETAYFVSTTTLKAEDYGGVIRKRLRTKITM